MKYVIPCVLMLFAGMLLSSCTSSPIRVATVGDGSLESIMVEEFNSLDYQGIYEQIPQPETRYIPDAKVAIKIAEVIFNSVYDESNLAAKKPFQVKFDDDQKVWLVHGTLPEEIDGGVPYIMLQQEDGKILSVWHDK
ncbi:NTF2 fold immunity protein [Paenibacillus paeoniae]|nr:NTF2 fold immunity protein [Paenibacillus paeoniae]